MRPPKYYFLWLDLLLALYSGMERHLQLAVMRSMKNGNERRLDGFWTKLGGKYPYSPPRSCKNGDGAG